MEKEFLIIDCTDPAGYTIRLVDARELLNELDRKREDKTFTIAVYKIGERLLDWS